MLARLKTERARQTEAELEAFRSQIGAEDMEEQLEANRACRAEVVKEAAEDKRLRKEQQRPSRALYPDVFFDDLQQEWACEHCGVRAHGDSPELACENFDHLWMFGNEETSRI